MKIKPPRPEYPLQAEHLQMPQDAILFWAGERLREAGQMIYISTTIKEIFIQIWIRIRFAICSCAKISIAKVFCIFRPFWQATPKTKRARTAAHLHTHTLAHTQLPYNRIFIGAACDNCPSLYPPVSPSARAPQLLPQSPQFMAAFCDFYGFIMYAADYRAWYAN